MSEPPKAQPAGATPGGDIDEPVPKLPRGRGLRLSGPELFRIGLTLLTLIGVIVLTRPCANAVSGFVTSFDGSGSASEKQMPKPGTVDLPGSAGSPAPAEPVYETLRPGMTEAEIKAAMERSKARNAGGSAAGNAAGSAGSAAGSAGSAAGSAGSASIAPLR